jgi:HEAT repeat protein
LDPNRFLIELTAEGSSASILGVIAALGVAIYILYHYGVLGWVVGQIGRGVRWSIRWGFFAWEATFSWAHWLVYLSIAVVLLALGTLAAGTAPVVTLVFAAVVIFMGVTACLAYMYIDLERYEVERGYKAVHNPLKGQDLAPHLAKYGPQVDLYLLFASTVATIGGFALLNQGLYESIGQRWYRVHEGGVGYSDFLTYAFLNLLRVVDVLDLARSQRLLQVSLVRPGAWPASTLIVVFRTFFTLVLLQQIFASIRQGRLLAETIADFWSPHEPIQQRARRALPQYGSAAISPLLVSLRTVTALTKEQRDQLPQILAAIGPTTAATLMRHLADPHEHVRAVSAASLGHLNAREALPALADLTKDPSDHVRQSLADALSLYAAAAARSDKLAGVRRARSRRRWFRRSAIPNQPPFDPMAVILSTLRQLLADENAAVRSEAAAALAGAGQAAAAAVPDLMFRLGDADETVRCGAAEALGKVGGGEEAVRALVATLEDPSTVVRAAAARGLSALGTGARAAIPALVPLLQDREEAVRTAAAEAISAAGPLDEEATASLVEGMDSPDNVVRAQAAEALGEVGAAVDEAAEALASGLRDSNDVVRQKAAEALGKIGEAAADVAVPRLVKALRDRDSWVTALAAEALGEMGDSADEAVPALVRALEHVNAQVRANAAEALGKLGDAAERARSRLETAAADEEGTVRAAAVRALARLGPMTRTSRRLIVDSLRDLDPQVREAAAEAISFADLPPAEVEGLLLPLLGDAADAVKIQAAGVLARQVGPVPAVVTELCRLMTDDDSAEVQANAARGIARLGPGAAAAGAALVRAAQTGEASVREHAMRALAVVLPPEAPEAFRVGLKDPSADVRLIASAGWMKVPTVPTEALEGLVAALKDPEMQVRANAALVLSRHDPLPAEAFPQLIECMTETNDSLRFNAVLALRKAPPDDSMDVMEHLLEDPNTRVRLVAAGAVLAATPDHAIARAVVEAAKSDPSPRVRQSAEELLLALAQPAAESEEPAAVEPRVVEPGADTALQMTS